MHVERRRKRSNFAGLALQYYLASVARRTRVVSLVVADSAGLLVASSMKGPEADELAAIAPLLMRSDEEGSCPVDRHKLPLVIEKVPVDRSSLFVCAVGIQQRCADSVKQAKSGVRRILEAQAA